MLTFSDSDSPVILFGYGSAGRMIYGMLTAAKHKISVVDDDLSRIEAAKAEGIADALCIDLTDDAQIGEIGVIDGKQILYCSLDDVSMNIFLTLSLRTLYPESAIIAISNSVENSKKLHYCGADKVIDIYESSANRIVNILTRPAVTQVMDEIIFVQNDISIEEIVLPPGSFLENKKISEVNLGGFGIIMVGIADKELSDQMILATKGIDHKLDSGDILVVVGYDVDLERFKQKIGAAP